MMEAAQAAPDIGVKPACMALGLSRATFYRRRSPAHAVVKPRPSSPRALTQEERQTILAALNSDRFADQAPAEVYATLLDEGTYLCSIRTMYRLLHEHKSVRERRNMTRHGSYKKPELLATVPNQVWSWDITKLRGPAKWVYFYLYVILDIFSRRVVGWCVADRECAILFQSMFEETMAKHEVPPGQLTLHADRGGPMTAKTTTQLLLDLGVEKTHNRPYTSNDNPFSEAAFKTVKYHHQFPEQFGCIEDAKAFSRSFFDWYNNDHHHSALGLMTPNQIHYGQADHIIAARQQVLTQAYHAHPQRFVRHRPVPPAKPVAVWINPPQEKQNENKIV